MNKHKYSTNGWCHDYRTRKREDYVIPAHRIKRTPQSLQYWTIKFDNELPHETKVLGVRTFNKETKKFLLKTPVYAFDDDFNLFKTQK